MRILISILAIIIMILVHEWGHFIAARICKVPVYEFAVGFGPKLFSRKGKKETVWSIRAIPLGGFCSFDDISKNGTVNGITDVALEKIPARKKVFICAAGPLMNIVLGLLIVIACTFIFGLADMSNKISGFTDNNVGGNIAEYLEVGDEIIEVDGMDVSAHNETKLQDYMTNDFKGGELHVKVIKGEDGSIKEYDIKPYYSEENKRYYLGYKLTVDYVRPNIIDGLGYSIKTTASYVYGVFEGIYDLFSGKYKFSEVSGIVGIVDYMSDNAKFDFIEDFLLIAAFISVNLGVMNLLPIPPLDGSKILQTGIEKVARKKIPEKVIVVTTVASFSLLIILSVVLAVFDITKIVSG